MKYLLITISIVSLLSCENKTLTKNDIQKILDSSKIYNEYTLKKDFKIDYIDNKIDSASINNIILKENYKPYYIADFNRDGYKDYLLNLDLKPQKDSSSIIILPINEYKNFVILLSKNRKEFDLIDFENKRIYFDFIGAKTTNLGKFEIMRFKPHFYEFNQNSLEKIDFEIKNKQIKEVAENKNLPISKIVLKDINGWTGENYTIELKKDSIILNSKFYNDLKGKYFAKKNLEFQNLSKYLNEIGFSDLNDKYSIMCNDCGAKEITIFYGNNSKKTIYDYGERASLNLARFYDKIDEIMKDLKWQKIN